MTWKKQRKGLWPPSGQIDWIDTWSRKTINQFDPPAKYLSECCELLKVPMFDHIIKASASTLLKTSFWYFDSVHWKVLIMWKVIMINKYTWIYKKLRTSCDSKGNITLYFWVCHKELKLPLEKRNPDLSHLLFELKRSQKKGPTFLVRKSWTKLFDQLKLTKTNL